MWDLQDLFQKIQKHFHKKWLQKNVAKVFWTFIGKLSAPSAFLKPEMVQIKTYRETLFQSRSGLFVLNRLTAATGLLSLPLMGSLVVEQNWLTHPDLTLK